MREQNMSDGRSVVEPQQSQNKLNRVESKHNYQELSQHCKPNVFQFFKKTEKTMVINISPTGNRGVEI